MPESDPKLLSTGHDSDTPVQRPTVAPLTDWEILELQQLAQLSYWTQLHRAPNSGGDGPAPRSNLQPGAPPIHWRLLGDKTLYEWQEQAIGAWIARRRGIIKVVTGAGKTMLALGVMERLQNRLCPDLRVAVVVPTVVLLDQWRDIFLTQTNLPPSWIATLGGPSGQSFDPEARVIIAVINSAATRLPDLVKKTGIGNSLLLVVDECHRAGAAERRRLFETPRAFSLGLSATPEREDRDLDDLDVDEVDLSAEPKIAGDDVLLAELGPIIYEMNYAEAVEKGVLAPFVIEHYGLTLKPHERNRYEKLSREITDLRRDLEKRTRRGLALLRWCRSAAGQKDFRAQRFLSLTTERKLLLYRAEARLAAVQQLIKQAFETYQRPRIIIFHESIDDVMIIFDSLRKLGLPVVAEHSEFPDKMRSESIRLFRAGVAQVIVSARSLIEGFNVPSADIGIVAAASGSVRQRVQTLGRLLRPDPTKTKKARLIVLYMADTVDEFLYEKADWETFIGAERNEYYKWLDVEVARPEHVGTPPRRPPLKDVAIDSENLQVGREYPGVFEGAIYSVDTQGGITDEAGNLHKPTTAFQAIIRAWVKNGGRFAVTPSRKFVLRIERGHGSSKVIFIGRAPDPMFLRDREHAASDETKAAELVVGEPYPFSVQGARRFSVLQRDARLIGMKEKGSVRFVVEPDKIEDPTKATQLRHLIEHLRGTYQSGKLISRIYVMQNGDVIYPYGGSYYFAGKAPEGERGFIFE